MPDIISASDIKALVGSQGTADDTAYGLLAAGISAFVANSCGLDFVAQDYTELLDGSGKDTFFLSQGPINSVASLSIDGAAIQAGEYAIYRNKIRLKSLTFTRGIQNVAITYNAGLLTQDVKRACELIAVHWFHRRRTVGKSAESMSNASISIDKEDIPPEAEIILGKRQKTWGFLDSGLG